MPHIHSYHEWVVEEDVDDFTNSFYFDRIAAARRFWRDCPTAARFGLVRREWEDDDPSGEVTHFYAYFDQEGRLPAHFDDYGPPVPARYKACRRKAEHHRDHDRSRGGAANDP